MGTPSSGTASCRCAPPTPFPDFFCPYHASLLREASLDLVCCLSLSGMCKYLALIVCWAHGSVSLHVEEVWDGLG